MESTLSGKTQAGSPPPQTVTIFLRPTFAIVPTVGGLDVRVVAAAPARNEPTASQPVARA